MFTRKPRLQLEKFAINGANYNTIGTNLPIGNVSHLRSVIFCRSDRPRPIDTWRTSAQTRPRLPPVRP